jgi:DUF971 family protein
MPEATVARNFKVASLNMVGRYAVGVRWGDGHDSIYPLENLRRFCPCARCNGFVGGEIRSAAQSLAELSRLGESGLFLSWKDGHETLYTTRRLRELCRCARCAGEPEKPISGG